MLFYELTFLRKEFAMENKEHSTQQEQDQVKEDETPGEVIAAPTFFSPEHRRDFKEQIGDDLL